MFGAARACAARRSVCAAVVLCLLFGPAVGARTRSWLEDVEPLLLPKERKLYLSLRGDAERAAFQSQFWAGKKISAEDYSRRIAYVDSAFGKGTDRARLYLSLGPPQGITRLASSRTFFPIEIWRYDGAPDAGIQYALQFLFFQRNGTGDYKIYSPTIDSIRSLMNPQPGTRSMFHVNDVISAADIRTNLTLSPVEDEVIEAATGVARGITGSGNEEIIALVMSPETVLSGNAKTAKTKVTSHLVAMDDRPVLSTFETWSEDGFSTVELTLETRLKRSIGVELSQGFFTIEEADTTVNLPGETRVRYEHQFDLLPGAYRVIFHVDGNYFPYAFEVKGKLPVGALRVDASPNGLLGKLQLTAAQRVEWRLAQGATTRWSATTLTGGIVLQDIGSRDTPPGRYMLYVTAGGETRSQAVEIGAAENKDLTISYNANRASGERYSSLGRQWLARGNLRESKSWLQRAWNVQRSDRTLVDLCRIGALEGDLDGTRKVLRSILERDADNFEALTLSGYIAAQLQDYKIAVKYYRKALEVRRSPALEKAMGEVQLMLAGR